jgi:transcriptional regulator with XRE-family HTH domain
MDYLRSKVKSGELTERRLARMAGISQPHLHNVMKGVRILSPAAADTVIANLHVTAGDLLREEERQAVGQASAGPAHREIPVAAGPLGPSYPFPDLQKSAGRIPFPAAELEGIAEAVAVRLSADPQAPSLFRDGDTVLLEILPEGARNLDAGSYYAIDVEGHGLLRCHQPAAEPAGGTVRAKVIWMGRHLKTGLDAAPLD